MEISKADDALRIEDSSGALQGAIDHVVVTKQGESICESTATYANGATLRAVFKGDENGALSLEFHNSDADGNVTMEVFDLVKRGAAQVSA